MSIKANKLDYILEIPKSGYYPHSNEAYNIYYKADKNPNKKHAIGDYEIEDNPYNLIRKGYWVFYSKSKNLVECGTFADNGKKFGTWFGYFGGKKDLNDRLKHETN